LKHADIGFEGSDLDKIRTVREDECGDCLDTAHPHVVKDDVAADPAQWGIQVEIDEHIVKAMVAIDKDDVEGRMGTREVNGGTIGAIFDKGEGRRRGVRGSDSLGMGKTDSVPLGTLKRIDAGVVASQILREGREEKEGALAIRHADLEGRLRFCGQA
jgi:hypothetical protein